MKVNHCDKCGISKEIHSEVIKIKDEAVISCNRLQSQLQTKDDEIEKLKNQLVNILYQTEVFKPIAIANTLRQFLRLNVPDYKERRQETLKEAE